LDKSENIDSVLLEKLSDGRFHSGEVLGKSLGISRTAIHNHIEKLSELGLDIFRIAGKGYRLSQPISLLNAQAISKSLNAYGGSSRLSIPYSVRPVTGSTNDDLKHMLSLAQKENRSLESGTAVLSEMQTQGRGRRGKPWYSPFGSNIYMSMYWPLHQGLNAAIGLSVSLGFNIARMLQDAGINGVTAKWPNDVYIERKKVAGILVELEGQSVGEGHAIIGIGLNLNMPQNSSSIDQPYTAVADHMNDPVDRNVWAARLMHACFSALDNHDQNGLRDVVEEWKTIDHYYNVPVELHMGRHIQRGVAKGIDELGALLLLQEGPGNQQEVKRYFGGEISVRASD